MHRTTKQQSKRTKTPITKQKSQKNPQLENKALRGYIQSGGPKKAIFQEFFLRRLLNLSTQKFYTYYGNF